MKKLIVNADDFGINEVVTSEIERMIEIGAISSTTVMANGQCLNEVKQFTSRHPEISFGIHLCLSEFDSITKSKSLHEAGLTDENGRFIHKAIFHLNNLNDFKVQQAIRDELNAQIDIVKSLGFSISHADSHHHVHSIYQLRELFADVLKKQELRKVRLGSEFLTLRMKRHLILWMKRKRLNKFYSSQFKTTDAFYSYAEYINNEVQCDKQVLELMCHPGHPGNHFQDEMILVEEKQAIKESEIQLISYNDL